MATRTHHVEHVIAYSLIEDAHLSWEARLLSAYLAGFGSRSTSSPRDVRVMQALNISAERLAEIKRELFERSALWSHAGETRYGSVYEQRVDIRTALTLPTGWRRDWRFDLGRQAGMRWLARYSIEHPSRTLILLTLSLSISIDQRVPVRVPGEHFELMDTTPDLRTALDELTARGFIAYTWEQAEGLYVRWSPDFSRMLREYTRSWFAPSEGGVDAETAYGLRRWEQVGRQLPTNAETPEVWYFYTLTDPRTGLVRYAGISLDPQYRLLNNYCTSTEIRGRETTNPTLGAWLQGLQDEGLAPVHEIQDGMTVLGSRRDAERVEGDWIRSLHREGHPLLNVEHLYVAPRS